MSRQTDDLAALLEALDRLTADARRLRDAAHREVEQREGPGEESVRTIQMDAACESMEDARYWLWRARGTAAEYLPQTAAAPAAAHRRTQ
jgi:hypothetical protein